jgi:hypothetical protein
MSLICLAGCSWFGHKPPPPPAPTQIMVNGAPRDGVILVDGVQSKQPEQPIGRPFMITVPPGDHRIEIQVGDRMVYREDLYVPAGTRQPVTVLSGDTR